MYTFTMYSAESVVVEYMEPILMIKFKHKVIKLYLKTAINFNHKEAA